MKYLNKIWEWLCWLFFGMVAGIVIFVKFLDKPEYEVLIKKIKNKNITGGTVDNNVNIDIEREPTKRELRQERRKEKKQQKRKTRI